MKCIIGIASGAVIAIVLFNVASSWSGSVASIQDKLDEDKAVIAQARHAAFLDPRRDKQLMIEEVESIFQEYEKNPVRAKATFKAKLARYKGTIISVRETSFVMEFYDGSAKIICNMPSSEISSLDKGQKIEVSGYLSSFAFTDTTSKHFLSRISGFSIELTRCKVY